VSKAGKWTSDSFEQQSVEEWCEGFSASQMGKLKEAFQQTQDALKEFPQYAPKLKESLQNHKVSIRALFAADSVS